MRKFIFYFLWTIVTTTLALLFLPFISHCKFAMIGPRFLWPKSTLWLMKVICGIDYKLVGLEDLPRGGFIIASKHQSALETFILALTFSSAIFILKKELVQMPLVGVYLKATKMIAVDRSQGKKAIQHIKTQLEHIDPNAVFIIFPEGTRTTPGVRTEKYHSGIVLAYETLRWPVVPVALNTGLFWPKKGPITPGTATIKFLKPPNLKEYKRDSFVTQLNKVIEEESIELYKQHIRTQT